MRNRTRIAAAAVSVFLAYSVADIQAKIPELTLTPGAYITNWLVSGPLPNELQPFENGVEKRSGLFTDFLRELGGELKADVKAGTIIPELRALPFTNIICVTPAIDLNTLYGRPDHVCAYAICSIKVDEAGEYFVHAGSDDSIRVWMDDTLVIDKYADRGYRADEDWGKIKLEKGRHRITVKSEDNLGAWKFSVRLLDRAQHRKIIAANVSNTLDINLFTPTGAFAAAYLQFTTVPAVTDFVVTIKGRWISSEGRETQAFTCTPLEKIAIPGALFNQPQCTVDAQASGIPGRQPSAHINLYFTSTDQLLSNRTARIQQLLNTLSQTSLTARIALRHQGLLRYHLQNLRMYTNTMRFSNAIEAHRIVTSLDTILNELGRGIDYLGSVSGEYQAAYLSKADGSGQPFYVSVPTTYTPGTPMPLVVILHDAAKDYSDAFRQSASASLYIAVRVHGRGPNCAYIGLSAFDVLEAIDYMTNFYSIDPDRISLIGSSMGGYGVWNLASWYPGRFASIAPLNSFSAGNPLGNLRELAVTIIHGEEDLIMPVAFSRAAYTFLRNRLCPIVYNEIPKAGYHLQTAAELFRPVEWMLNYRREKTPQEVTLESMYSWNSAAYWLTDLVPELPRQQATLASRFYSKNDLLISCRNIRSATVQLPARYIDKDSLLSIIINGKQQKISAPLPPALFIRYSNETYQVRREPAAAVLNPYRRGSWQNFFNGEPLLIVQGTTGDAQQNAAIARCAQLIQRWSFPGRIMDTGVIPLLKDSQAATADLKAYNLILLGGPKENAYVKSLADSLAMPLKKTSLETKELSIPLEGRGAWIVQPNPGNPGRQVWIWASSDPAFYQPDADWIKDWTFPVEDPPDILVRLQGIDKYERALHFTHGWKLDPDDLASPFLSNRITSLEACVAIYVATLRRASDADMVWVSSTEQSRFAGLLRLRGSEAANLLFPHSQLMVCDVSGAELKAMIARMEQKAAPDSGRFYPPPPVLRETDIIRVAVTPRSLQTLSSASAHPLKNARYISAPLRQVFQEQVNLAQSPATEN